jgi:hypothetical protein
LSPCLKVVPDVTQLRNWAKDRTLHFVDIVRKAIGALYELGLRLIDNLQLNLADDEVIKLYVYQNIVGALLQPILNSHNLQLLGVNIADPLYLFKDIHNFLLLRGHPAPQEIAYLKGYKIGRGLPIIPRFVDLLLIKVFRNGKKSVNQSIEVESNVRMQVFNHMRCKFAGSFLVFGNASNAVLL